MKYQPFPKDFLWGAATSAYQVEGAAAQHGKGQSQQDVINKTYASKTGFADADVASDHYHHYKEDVQLFKEMGFTSYRFSIGWSRIFPDGTGKPNEEGVEFYRSLIRELKDNGIEPVITLYHYDLPWALVERYGGWVNRQVVEDFTEFSRYVIGEFKDEVRYWLTINEQSIIVQYWAQKCYIKEEYLDKNQLRYQINHHMNLAHAKAVELVHELVPGGLVGAALGYAPIYPLTSKAEDVMAAQNAHDLRNSYYTDIYFKGFYNEAAARYLEENGLAPVMDPRDMEYIKSQPSDFLALNYYASECAKHCSGEADRRWSGFNQSGKKGEMSGFETQPGFYQMCKNPHLDTTDWDWAIDPVGMEYMLRDLYTRYNKPLMITENGLGAFDTLTEDGKIHDTYRIDYLRNHIKAIQRAMHYGVEFWGYMPWSALDLLSTSNGMKKRYGLVYVNRTDEDPKDCVRVRKDSFFWYQKAIASQGQDLN